MNLPSITVRETPYKYKYKGNLLAVNSRNFEYVTERKIEDYLYMPSEISQLIAKLLLDSNIYVELSRLFKISLNKYIEFLQIVIVENVSHDQLMSDSFISKHDSLFHLLKQEKFSYINFFSPSSSKISGLDEFLTIPLKNLTAQGAELTGNSIKPLTPQILLSTPSEMFWDTIPFPNQTYLDEFVFSQDVYSTPDNDPMNLLAIDCEMVNTGNEDELELARISIVRCCRNAELKSIKGIKQWLSLSKSAAYETVYDKLVKPEKHVVDYLTNYSGITEKLLENVLTTLSDVHWLLKDVIKSNTILVGHSIKSDLRALKIYHPYIIDTSSIYNISGDFTRKPGLLPLSNEILKQEMRKNGNKGHDSIEDAQTALRLVIMKLSKDLNFGNKTRNVFVPSNSVATEIINVGNVTNQSSNLLVKDSSFLGNPSKNQSKSVFQCVLKCDETHRSLDSIENTDMQMKLDKFMLLKEQPAVVKTSDLLYKMKIALHIIVNTQGIIGRQQKENSCKTFIKVSNDRDVVKETNKYVNRCDVLISVLSEFSEVEPSSQEFNLKRKMASVRSNIKEIIKAVPKKSAIFVILPGNSGVPGIGKFFWKIS